MDSPPPPPPAIVAPATAAAAPAAPERPPAAVTDIHPRDARERDLCRSASTFDWLYMSALLLSNVGSVYLDGYVFKEDRRPWVRLTGAGIAGLTWGWSIGAIYPSLPKCDANWVVHPPPEGDVRSTYPLVIAMTMLAGVTAPMFVAVETGPQDDNWLLSERVARVIVPGITGAIGALIPYVLPPKTWRAAKELERIRAYGDMQGVFLGYRVSF